VSNYALAAVLARTSNVLLDFDGPVCSVFSDFPPAQVAAELRARLDLDAMPPTTEPFDVLRYVAHNRPTSAARAEAELARMETIAIATAEPTPGAADALRHFADSGRSVVVVSNNSTNAIRAYLDQHDLGRYVAGVSARTDPDPNLLKPNPHLLRRAIELLESTSSNCLMIGDSLTDIEAARAAGSPGIAYANKPAKWERFAPQQPDAIIGHMTELLTVDVAT
jgi:HAD superfamily hydrolase (TIGR01662 family)